jgi:hypothetical protein
VTDTSTGFLERLDAVEARLQGHIDRELPPGARTAPDPPTGERWEAGQVWAHLAEFIPYWLAEAGVLLDHRGDAEPVPFGRTKTDAGRVAAIERDRHGDRRRLGARTLGDIASLRSFLISLDERAWSARGVHPTLGVLDLPRFVDEFLVGHLEQHADQLDELAGARR